MNRAKQWAWVIAAVISYPLAAGDLTREISLIERLGKAEAQKAARAQQPPTLQETLAASKTIDQYLETFYREHKVQPNPRAEDEAFLRRAYLDIVGRIPTLKETLDFLGDKSPTKRSKLIDRLLDSEGFVAHNFNFWADLLRVQSSNQGNGVYGGQAYANWVKKAIRDNKPYDKMVYELVTASGYPWENGAVGYYLRDDGMPLDNMALTVQVFLGTSLVCAQCHDHPFDKWTQHEFYEMSAFTYGVNTRHHPENVNKALELAKDDFSVRRALEQMTRSLTYGVSDGQKDLQLPHDYQYKDAKPFELVKSKTIFGDKVELSEGQKMREAYAQWIIARQNPRFTITFSHRIWKKVVGAGLIEPVDQMTEESQPVYPELMAFLVHKMESYNYDLKQYLRMLYNTQLYQRQVLVEDLVDGAPYHFNGPLLKRMSAEQVWDSLVTLAIPEPDYRRGELSDPARMQNLMAMLKAEPEQLLAMAKDQAQYEQERRDLSDKIRDARKAGNTKMVDALEKQRSALRNPSMMAMEMMDKKPASASGSAGTLGYGYDMPTKDPKTWEGLPEYLVRASELPSPAPGGHFLREFGQSDREVINNAFADSNLIQVLGMFNGPMLQDVIQPWSQLMKNIEKINTPLDKVKLIYYTLLSREPTSNEKQIIEAMILQPAYQKAHEPDYGKLVWAILNTREFSFVQ